MTWSSSLAEIATRTRPEPETLVLDVQPGRQLSAAIMSRSPRVLVPAIHLTRGQATDLSELLSVAQSITQGFRPIVLADERLLDVFAPYGWVTEHHPSEAMWLGDRAPRTWTESLTRKARLASESYGCSLALDVDARDRFRGAFSILSTVTGVDLVPLLAPLNRGAQRPNATDVSGFQTWLPWVEAGRTQTASVEIARDRSTAVTFTRRRGSGIVVIDGREADGWVEFARRLAEHAGWSMLTIDDIESVGRSNIASALVGAIQGLRPIVCPVGPAAIAHFSVSPGSFVVVSAPTRAASPADGATNAARDLVRSAARAVFAS